MHIRESGSGGRSHLTVRGQHCMDIGLWSGLGSGLGLGLGLGLGYWLNPRYKPGLVLITFWWEG